MFRSVKAVLRCGSGESENVSWLVCNDQVVAAQSVVGPRGIDSQCRRQIFHPHLLIADVIGKKTWVSRTLSLIEARTKDVGESYHDMRVLILNCGKDFRRLRAGTAVNLTFDNLRVKFFGPKIFTHRFILVCDEY